MKWYTDSNHYGYTKLHLFIVFNENQSILWHNTRKDKKTLTTHWLYLKWGDGSRGTVYNVIYLSLILLEKHKNNLE